MSPPKLFSDCHPCLPVTRWPWPERLSYTQLVELDPLVNKPLLSAAISYVDLSIVCCCMIWPPDNVGICSTFIKLSYGKVKSFILIFRTSPQALWKMWQQNWDWKDDKGRDVWRRVFQAAGRAQTKEQREECRVWFGPSPCPLGLKDRVTCLRKSREKAKNMSLGVRTQ